MAVQILPNQIGEAFSTGLQELAQNKLNQITEKHERDRYSKSLRSVLPEKIADFLTNLNPREREAILKNLNLNKLLEQNEPDEEQNGLGELLQQYVQPQQSPNNFGQKTQQQDPYQQLLQAASQFSSPLGQMQQQQSDNGLKSLLQPPQQQAEKETVGPQLNHQLIPKKEIKGQNLFETPHERRENEKLDIQKRRLTSQENKDIREFSAPYRERSKKAQASIRDYQQLLKDARSGELRSGNVYQLLKKLGLEEFGRNITTELAEKVVARLGQNIEGKFGKNARLTNFLEQTFQRSLPTLKNTPEGIQIIAISNMAVEEADVIKDDIRKEVIKKYGLNDETDDIIEELAAPFIKKIDDEATEYAQSIIDNKGNKNSFDKLPPAKYFKGEIIDGENGEILQSNGKEWVRKDNRK